MKFFAVKNFEIFQKLHDAFFGQYTHPFNIFHMSDITFHSFMHTAAPYAYLQAYLLGLLL